MIEPKSRIAATSWLAALTMSLIGCDPSNSQSPLTPTLADGSMDDAGSQTPADGAKKTGTRAVFDLQRVDSDLYAIPYPNDFRSREDGTIDLAGMEQRADGIIKLYLQTVIANPNRGFASGGAAHFRFRGPLDESSLPQTAGASLEAESGLFLVNIDTDSPVFGQRTPVRWQFTTEEQLYIGDNSLAVMPADGFVLPPGQTHAIIITDTIRGADGAALQPSADFQQVLQEPSPGTGAPARAHQVYAPLRSYLQQSAVEPVVSAAVFTTGRPTELARRARQAVHKMPPPLPSLLKVTRNTANYVELEGVYRAPNFQRGLPPYFTSGGEFVLDASDEPLVQTTEELRFVLTVPKGTMPPSGWPIVIYAHGTGGSYRSVVVSNVANRLARVTDDSDSVIARIATVGIDQVLHGPRAPGGTPPSVTFFNLNNPLASIHNVIQGGVDNFSLVRMLKELSIAIAPGAETGIEAVTFSPPAKFDPLQVSFMGHSQGSITGPVFLAHEPKVNAAVLSGAGGGAVLGILEKTQPTAIAPLVSLALRESASVFHPVMALVQQMLEPADTANYGRLMIQRPPSGVSPKNTLIIQGIIDHFTPNPTTDVLSIATGLPLAGPQLRPINDLELAGIQAASLPMSGNIVRDGTPVTGAVVQHAAALTETACQSDSQCEGTDYCVTSQNLCAEDGHFVAFSQPDAIRQYTRFFATAVRDGTPTLVP